jgi:hypothetical protein
MFSFMASQAIALSQAKQEPSKSPARGQQGIAQPARKGFWSRVLDAMVNSRARRAQMEIRYHRGLHEESPKQ